VRRCAALICAAPVYGPHLTILPARRRIRNAAAVARSIITQASLALPHGWQLKPRLDGQRAVQPACADS
jgi:hypothetical protein